MKRALSWARRYEVVGLRPVPAVEGRQQAVEIRWLLMIVEALVEKSEAVTLKLPFVIKQRDRPAKTVSIPVAIPYNHDEVFTGFRVSVYFKLDLAVAMKKMRRPGLAAATALPNPDRPGAGRRGRAVVIIIGGV